CLLCLLLRSHVQTAVTGFSLGVSSQVNLLGRKENRVTYPPMLGFTCLCTSPGQSCETTSRHAHHCAASSGRHVCCTSPLVVPARLGAHPLRESAVTDSLTVPVGAVRRYP